MKPSVTIRTVYRTKQLVIVAAFALLASLAPFRVPGAAAATVYYVDDDRAQCPQATFTSIQAAVLASGPGGTIVVCPGTYQEQVAVPAGKDGLTIRSRTPLAAIIKAPPTIAADAVNFKSIVRVTTSRDVTLYGFTITGPGPGPCDSLRAGVRVDGGGLANIIRNHITEIRDTPFGGCQNGIAIFVGRQFEGQVGLARIFDNTLDRYQKGGIVVDNAGSHADIVGNRVQGSGPTPAIAQNGIQVSRGATAEVWYNQVFDHTYSLANAGLYSSTGILLYQPASGGVRIARNTVARNDDNIALYTTGGSRIVENQATDSTFYDGIYVDVGSTNNRLTGNVALRNAEHDCHDDSRGVGTAGTANFWNGNRGNTATPAGICRPNGGNDDRGDKSDDQRDGKERTDKKNE